MIGSRGLAALMIGAASLVSGAAYLAWPAWSAELVVVEVRGLGLKPGHEVGAVPDGVPRERHLLAEV